MKHAFFAAVLIALSWSFSPASVDAASEAGVIGFVQNVSGAASIQREGATIPAAAGTELRAGDTLSTGPDGSLGIVLKDDSTISLGPDSGFIVRNFEFSPSEGKTGFLIRITKGSFAYLSGLIGKMSPESAQFETPTATIGIRGTHFVVEVGKPDLQ